MKLKHFCEEFDIPRTTALQWAHSLNFPAYNLCGRWYVDIERYHKWRQIEHARSYK